MFANRRVSALLAAPLLTLAAGGLALGCASQSATPAAESSQAATEGQPADQTAADAPAVEVPAAEAGEPEAAEPAVATLGQPAPNFTLVDLDGSEVELAGFRGKTVVLEWFNPGCPFVKFAHGKGPFSDPTKMPGAGDDSVVWLAINSSAAGKQGHGEELNTKARADWGMAYPLLIDESGEVGRRYDAKTTPHMFVIDAQGVLVYRGAVDNAPLGKVKGGAPVNYVQAALADLAAGRPVQTAETQSYGCGVKY